MRSAEKGFEYTKTYGKTSKSVAQRWTIPHHSRSTNQSNFITNK